MDNENRRTFVRTVAITAASASRILGANDRVNIGVVGLGGRGHDHMKAWSTAARSRIWRLCDVNQAALESGQARSRKLTGEQAEGLRRHAQALRRQGRRRGLHRHCPTTGTRWRPSGPARPARTSTSKSRPATTSTKAQRMVEAARKYNRMVQIGSQSRSTPHKMQGDAAAAGRRHRQGLPGQGPLLQAAPVHRTQADDGPVPPGSDWDMFLGPAPMRPFNELRFKYNWHWFWDTGNGDIGNQGVHEMDIARWGLGSEDLPQVVVDRRQVSSTTTIRRRPTPRSPPSTTATRS